VLLADEILDENIESYDVLGESNLDFDDGDFEENPDLEEFEDEDHEGDSGYHMQNRGGSQNQYEDDPNQNDFIEDDPEVDIEEEFFEEAEEEDENSYPEEDDFENSNFEVDDEDEIPFPDDDDGELFSSKTFLIYCNYCYQICRNQ